MKLMYAGKHTKTIPKRFESILNLEHYIEDFDRKRLTKSERFNMELVLFRSELGRHEKELVEGLSYVRSESVKTNEGGHYYTVVFGMYAIKCPIELYNCSIIQVHKNVNE